MITGTALLLVVPRFSFQPLSRDASGLRADWERPGTTDLERVRGCGRYASCGSQGRQSSSSVSLSEIGPWDLQPCLGAAGGHQRSGWDAVRVAGSVD